MVQGCFSLLCAASSQSRPITAPSTGQDSPSRTGGGRRGSCPGERRWCEASGAGWWPQAPRRSAGSSSTPAGISARADSNQQHQSSARQLPWHWRSGRKPEQREGAGSGTRLGTCSGESWGSPEHLLTAWAREQGLDETLQAAFKFEVCLRLGFFWGFYVFMKSNSNIYRDSFEQVLSKGKQIKSPLKSNLPSTHVPEATLLWIRRLGLFSLPFFPLFFFYF